MTTKPLLRSLLLTLFACSLTMRAAAEANPWSVRGTVEMAMMVSEDQLRRPFTFDLPGFVGSVRAGYAIWPSLELRAGVLGGPFIASEGKTGGLLAGTFGPRLLLPDRRLRPYVALDFGAGMTGELLRPYLGGSAGVDIAIGERLMVGPAFGLANLFQWNGANYSTDAGYFTFGISVWQKLGAREQKPPKPAAKPVRVAPPSPPPPPPPPPPPEPEEDVLLLIEQALPSTTQRVELLAPVLFGFDSDELEPIGTAMLHEVANTLKTRDDIELLQIQGYADARGASSYNEALSLRRAERVRDWLVAHGIDEARLSIDAHGASSFVEEGGEEPAHTQNRRVIFRVLRTREP